ncbi:MAG: hypothetical protein H0X34_03090 [Chthoniobacterales bacterium]|nr:hypothetical protein [Chthoniobacterales bacterium]
MNRGDCPERLSSVLVKATGAFTATMFDWKSVLSFASSLRSFSTSARSLGGRPRPARR